MLIGYARVSTPDQSLDLQRDALLAAGCDPNHLYTDVASGAKADRPGLEAALHYIREGDTLVVWKLDRLGRSLTHLIETVHALGRARHRLQEPARAYRHHDAGRQADLPRLRGAGRVRARPDRRAHQGGPQSRPCPRPQGRAQTGAHPKQIALAKSMKADPHNSIADICATLGISKRTLYRYTGKQVSVTSHQ